MKLSHSSTLLSLYKKDLLSVKFESLMILATIFLGHLYFSYRILTGWPTPTILGVTFTIFFIITFVIFIGTFTSISREWSNNTIYLVMSLPVGGKKILLSKLLAVMTQLIVLGGTSILVGTLLSSYFLGNEFLLKSLGILSNPELAQLLIQILVLLFAGVIQIIMVVFFSSIIGRLFKRFSNFITLITFVLTNIAIGKVSGFLINAMTPLNNSPIRFRSDPSYVNEISVIGGISVSQFFTLLITITIVSTVLFFITSAIYDKKVEL